MDEPLGALDKQLRDLVVADSDGFMVKVPFTDSAEAFQTGHAVSVCWAAKDCRALDPV
jgi:putative spermidine/putrescine transport system ATP-binding protein